jgi:CheY-like chemotaxis protein
MDTRLSGTSCFRYVCAQKEKLTNEQALPRINSVILLIEDNLDDVELFRLALIKGGSPCEVISVQFARDGIKYLARLGEYADKKKFPKPILIVLDLSLPGMTGTEFLIWAKGEPPENIPPIVVLSSSQLELNRHLTERFGAKAYFVKSARPEEVEEITKQLLLFNAPLSSPTDFLLAGNGAESTPEQFNRR